MRQVGVGVIEVFSGNVQQIARCPLVGSALPIADTSAGKAGSAAMVSASSVPNTVCRSGSQSGRSPPLAVSSAAGVRVPHSRHHSAAAGNSSGSGRSAATVRTSWVMLTPVRAAAAR